MRTIVQKIDKDKFVGSELNKASEILQKGGLVAFPTETVYGLGGNALDKMASGKIYEAKGRPSDNPLIVHVGRIEDLESLTLEVPIKARKLAEVFWPGPLTMIFNKSNVVPYSTTGGLDTVAIRIPQHPISLALIQYSGVCLAAPSANASGKPSPTLASHVVQDLDGKIDMIIDGGPVGIGIESTIVDMTVDPPVILRPGYVTKEMLEEIVGEVQVDPAILPIEGNSSVAPKAPGMKYKHYAPKGELTIWEGSSQRVIDEINKKAEELVEQGIKVGILATSENYQFYQWGVIKDIGSKDDKQLIAKRLYAVLREFDDLEIEYIFSESFDSQKLGHAIMNRLRKAAGYRIIKVDEGV